jgi:hypothetical protein
MILGTFIQQPSDKLDYDVIYDDWMVQSDAIDASKSSVIADNPALTVFFTVTGNTVKVWVANGTNKATYKITVTIETEDGRIKQDEFIVKFKDY